jgi:tuftelin-interacting protein 11
MRDNILDQLILPKLSSAVSNWSPSLARKKGIHLHSIVLSWLPLAGEIRMKELVGECKRKITSWLSNLKLSDYSDPMPPGIELWREVFGEKDWESIVMKTILPGLGAYLREKFEVNPGDQDVKPLERVLEWSKVLKGRMLEKLLEKEFFGKWLEVLYVWLVSDGVRYGEVADWSVSFYWFMNFTGLITGYIRYKNWKEFFPENVRKLKGVEKGFTKALDLMNQADLYGKDAKYK